MPIETTVTLCGNCGAALERRAAEVALQCAYCRQTTYLAPTSTPEPPDEPEVVAPAAGSALTLHQRLLRGPTGAAQGVGVRYSPSQMSTRDVPAVERGLWPVGAHASSTFGGSWSPSALLGPARVYPRCGDIGGAWAPAPRKSPVEWVELEYAAEVPVAAVRVFETNRPGSTFAVVDVTHGEQLLYEGPPRSDGSAQVLEVAVTPPRVVRRLRVYVVNPGWAEIDTVGLLADAPLPEALRTRPASPSRGGGGGGGGVSIALGAALIVIAFVVAVATRGRAPARVTAPTTPLRARPALLVAGATVRHLDLPPEAFAVRGVAWASEVTGFSSEFSAITNAAAGVRGAPDVYPQYGDIDGAWASLATDAGEEWIEVRFEAPVTTTRVLWVETFNPGAVSRVDDVSDPAAPAVLWEGASPPQPAASAVAELTLPAPRTIRALRLVLDSPRVPGWNEIDAIGLARSP